MDTPEVDGRGQEMPATLEQSSESRQAAEAWQHKSIRESGAAVATGAAPRRASREEARRQRVEESPWEDATTVHSETTASTLRTANHPSFRQRARAPTFGSLLPPEAGGLLSSKLAEVRRRAI